MFDTKYVISKGLAFGEDEEMKMLSEYASKGWILYKLGFMGYKLKKSKPENLQYSLDYRKNTDKEYFSYFEEAGWNHVCSASNLMHIFSAPEGTKPIYTDSDTKSEKYISQYKLTKKIAVPSLLCLILFVILHSLTYKHLSNTYNTILNVISMAALVLTIFSGLPCISYYITLNRVEKDSSNSKNHKTVKKLLFRAALIICILLIFIILLSKFNVIHIGVMPIFLISTIGIITCLLSAFMK